MKKLLLFLGLLASLSSFAQQSYQKTAVIIDSLKLGSNWYSSLLESITIGNYLSSSSSPLTGTGSIGVGPELSSLAAYSANISIGIIAKTGSNIFVSRSFGSTYPIAITNADGVAGTPSFSLDTSHFRSKEYFDGVYLSLNGGTMAGAIIQPNLPVGAFDLINKTYFDNAMTGISWKNAVRAATTANITLSGTQTIDGVAVVAGNRVLVKNQTLAQNNGIYTVAAGAWTRPGDVDAADEVEQATVLVTLGTTNKNTQWTSSLPVATLGTDPIAFSQISGAGTYTNGSGLSLTGNVFSVGSGQIVNSMLANPTLSGVSLGGNLYDLTVGTGLQLNAGTAFNGSTAKTISVNSTAFIQNQSIARQTATAWFDTSKVVKAIADSIALNDNYRFLNNAALLMDSAHSKSGIYMYGRNLSPTKVYAHIYVSDSNTVKFDVGSENSALGKSLTILGGTSLTLGTSSSTLTMNSGSSSQFNTGVVGGYFLAGGLSFNQTTGYIDYSRNTSSANGADLTVRAQAGATNGGATNKNGGSLILSAGIATGTGTSDVGIYTSSAGSSGSADNTPTAKLTIKGSGNVGIGTASPEQLLHLKYGAGTNTLQFALKLTNTLASSGNAVGILFETGSTEGNRGKGGIAYVHDQSLGWNRGDLYFMQNSAASTALASTSDASMVIKNNGSVGVGTTSPASCALFDITTTTKGLLLPRMTKAQRDAISSPVAGLAIYQTDNTPGLRVYNGTNWIKYSETTD